MRHGLDAARNDAQGVPSRVARQAVPVVLVGTAVFLVVLILARSPLAGFVLSQRVYSAADRATTAAPLATEQVASWLKSDAVLAGAVQKVCPRDSLATQQNLILDLSRGLEVQPEPTRATQFGWQLTLQHRDRQLASRLLNALSESFKAQLKQLDQAEAQLLVQHYQKALLAAREDEDSARQAIERARHEQLTVAMKGSPLPALDLTPYFVPQPSPQTPERSKLNPVWQDLQQKVAAAKARLEQLLTARTVAHPQVIEAQAQLTQLEALLEQTPREPGVQLPKATAPAPAMQGPQLREAAKTDPRSTIQLTSTTDETAAGEPTAAGPLSESLTTRWTAATAKRANVERSWTEAQQQWVRGLNAEGWQVAPVVTQSQIGGRATTYQLLLAGAVALCAAIGTWRLGYLATRDKALTSTDELAGSLPLPVIGAVPLTTDFPRRLPERRNTQIVRLSQLSLATVIAVLLVITWANSVDLNLSAQWTSDPFSAIGQSFDLLQHRWLG